MAENFDAAKEAGFVVDLADLSIRWKQMNQDPISSFLFSYVDEERSKAEGREVKMNVATSNMLQFTLDETLNKLSGPQIKAMSDVDPRIELMEDSPHCFTLATIKTPHGALPTPVSDDIRTNLPTTKCY